MSVVTKLSTAAYCGYVIGEAVERRRNWMERARDLKRRGYSVQTAVQAARESSREIVEQLQRLREVRS